LKLIKIEDISVFCQEASVETYYSKVIMLSF